MESSGERDEPATTVREVLEAQAVRLGVLFGSRARGTAGTHSDVDIAVEFDESVDDRFRARLTLGADLARALSTDDVDVVDLDDVRPAVGYSALGRARSSSATPITRRPWRQRSNGNRRRRRPDADWLLLCVAGDTYRRTRQHRCHNRARWPMTDDFITLRVEMEPAAFDATRRSSYECRDEPPDRARPRVQIRTRPSVTR